MSLDNRLEDKEVLKWLTVFPEFGQVLILLVSAGNISANGTIAHYVKGSCQSPSFHMQQASFTPTIFQQESHQWIDWFPKAIHSPIFLYTERLSNFTVTNPHSSIPTHTAEYQPTQLDTNPHSSIPTHTARYQPTKLDTNPHSWIPTHTARYQPTQLDTNPHSSIPTHTARYPPTKLDTNMLNIYMNEIWSGSNSNSINGKNQI
jgi:hypothetical protein